MISEIQYYSAVKKLDALMGPNPETTKAILLNEPAQIVAQYYCEKIINKIAYMCKYKLETF